MADSSIFSEAFVEETIIDLYTEDVEAREGDDPTISSNDLLIN